MIELSPLDKERVEQIKQSAQLIIDRAEDIVVNARYSKNLDVVIRLSYDKKPDVGIKFDEIFESVVGYEERKEYNELT
mgnify:CR=1 FL=1